MATQKKNQKRQRKYIFVVGGVMSGVGKGIASSSIALLLKARGLKVTALKIDPYINVDAGTMNPTEHGEVFVLKDGTETDQDMGNYERFLELSLTGDNYMTTGSIYQEVIRRERNLEYKGKNVEVVPHIPLAVIEKIKKAADRADADVTLIEIGGTVGEYQNILFLEAVRMLKTELNGNVAVVLVSYLPVPGSIGEMKTKPTQYAARTLNSAGVFADIIIARSIVGVDEKRKEKIASFCNVKKENVISAPDVKSVYDVPLNFEKDGLSGKLCTILGLPVKGTADVRAWKRFVAKTKSVRKEVKIAVVGKYFSSGDFILSDVYISVLEAIKYSAYAAGAKPVITYLSSVDFENGKKKVSELSQFDGILIPGGFGSTGVEGKIKVIEYARTKGIPYFGICYGMQLAVVEYARNVLKLRGANTAEINANSPHKVIDVMPDQKEKIELSNLGGTMRLGEYPAVIAKDTIAAKAYDAKRIIERHRHRYEVNPEYVEQLEKGGVIFSGKSPSRMLMEIMELPKSEHPFFVGVQFHPEFHARPLSPHPIFSAFIQASLKKSPTRRK